MAKSTNIVANLRSRAAAVGSNLSEICRLAGVQRQAVEKWKKTPKTIITLRKLEAVLEKKERTQTA